jgi:hypothetical protein
MDQEHNDRELPPIQPITDAEKLEIVLVYLRLISESTNRNILSEISSQSPQQNSATGISIGLRPNQDRDVAPSH